MKPFGEWSVERGRQVGSIDPVDRLRRAAGGKLGKGEVREDREGHDR